MWRLSSFQNTTKFFSIDDIPAKELVHFVVCIKALWFCSFIGVLGADKDAVWYESENSEQLILLVLHLLNPNEKLCLWLHIHIDSDLDNYDGTQALKYGLLENDWIIICLSLIRTIYKHGKREENARQQPRQPCRSLKQCACSVANPKEVGRALSFLTGHSISDITHMDKNEHNHKTKQLNAEN